MTFTRILCFFTTFVSMATLAFAQESSPVAAKDRFSGRIELGLLGVTTDSSLSGIDERGFFGQDGDLRAINDLSGGKSFKTFGTLFLLFDVNYTLNDDTTLYIGTPFFDDNREGLTFGCEKLFNDNSNLDVSLFFGERSLWKDPYETGVKREITYSDSLGFTIDYDGLLGTELNIGYTLRHENVKDDIAGNNDSTLKRSGTNHTLKTGYNFYLNDMFDSMLTPSLLFVRDDVEGDANAYDAVGAELAYNMDQDNNALMLTLSVENETYDDIHPKFDTKRKQTTYTATCFYTRKNLWNDRWYSRIGFSYDHVDSNISFFDENNFLYGVSLGYAFH
jgi:hypothetical protein